MGTRNTCNQIHSFRHNNRIYDNILYKEIYNNTKYNITTIKKLL